MNFVQNLEESLRDLAAEARKRHPGVKEASERATLRLRALQNQYVSQVRQANNGDVNHPTTRLFGNSEILHPFLLAANYPNASAELLEIAFRAMRLLMEADAIQPVDAIQMLRVWMIQAQAVAAYYQKQYAKEIMLLEQQAESQQQTNLESSTGAAAATTSSLPSSSWFSWGSSSSSSNTATVDSNSKHGAVAQSTYSSTTTSQQSPAQMEHRAKQILSCLLQLLETLKLHPDHLTMELWTNATALSCLWLHYTPMKHTVHQAARSTLRQVMNVLFSTTKKSNDKLLVATWDDLLQLADHNMTQAFSLTGAFQLCKRNVAQTVTVHPPSPELALELLTQLLREHHTTLDRCMTDKLLQKTMGISVQLLQDKRANLFKSLRVVQWTGALFQHYRRSYPTECRELLALLLKPIQQATEACRSHDDFEDGYVFEDANDIVSAETTKGRLVTLIPPKTLWKAGFALEAINSILEHEDTAELLALLEDARIVVGLSETLSDFATIGASCTDHILQLVMFGKSLPFTGTEVFAKNSVKVKPTFFRRAEQACTSGNVESLLVDGTASKATDKTSPSGSLSSPGILGEALWISLQNLLRISECMNGEANVEQMLEHTFAPSLAVLQHYLKRCIGSSDLVQLVLKGYANLADVCLPMSVSHRKALLLSLCKLSLPTWGKRDPNGQLQNHHVMTLLYLCRIIHAHFEFILDDWEIVIRTLDELSVISMASKQLSDEFYYAALALSILFSRLAPFTTCFSSKSLLKVAEALTVIIKLRLEGLDVVGTNDTVVAQRAAPIGSVGRQTSGEGGESSISSKIINIGTRAIYGSGADTEKHPEATKKDRTAVVFYEDYRREFVKRLSSSKSSIRVSSVGNIPFVLAVLTDIIMSNSFRFEQCGDHLSEMLSSLASASPAVRPFTMDVLSVLAMSHLSSDRALPAPFVGPGQLIFADPMQSQLWAVETSSDELALDKTTSNSKEYDAKSQTELLSPLCQKIRTTDKPDMAESSLGALSAILEGVGHNMTGDVWCSVIDAIASLSGDPTYKIVDRTPALWSNCSSISFRCFKFIVDDFRDQLSTSDAASKTLTSLLDCCSSFGRSKHDVNISLTAITLLWTIADQDPGSDSIDRALSRLVDLASDGRAEVRNAAVNTLFSCIVGRGGTFSVPRWESCFSETIFGVYDSVAINASVGDAASKVDKQQNDKKYRVSLHHSRDSNQKQWLETQTLVLRGLTRLLRNYFTPLLEITESDAALEAGDTTSTASWVRDAWVKILDYTLEAATQDGGRDTVAIRTAGVELMVLCCQLASDAGIEAATAPARVGTGMEVVNGALRTVRETQPAKATTGKTHSANIVVARKQLYLEAFDSIETYTNTVEQAIKQGSAADETLVQVIHSFVTGLSHLYDCSRGSELLPKGMKILRSFERSGESAHADGDFGDLESRFVRIITSMLAASGGYSTSRFLNQGQRVSLNLLRTMASHGSALAFKELIDISEPALFSKRSSSASSISVLGYEASVAIAEEVVKDSVSSECKTFVLYQVLGAFLRHHDGDYKASTSAERSYENFIPIVTSGLVGLKQLRSDDPFSVKATELVWSSLTNCLSRLLSPATSEDGALTIGNVSDLLQIIAATKENVAETFVSELSTVLSFGASKALLVSRKQCAQINSGSNIDKETEARKEQQAQLINLFQACYASCCELQPDDQVLKSITKSVLSDAALDASSVENFSQAFNEEVALIICRCLQSDKLESLVIAAFAQLSRLATAPTASIRDAVSEVFNVVDVAGILDSARKKYEASEERAIIAEERVKDLSKKVKILQERNVELTQEVAVLQASSAM